MPSFGCNCGHRILLHAIPNPYEASLVWDIDRERLDDARRALRQDVIHASETGDYAAVYARLYREGHAPATPPKLDELLDRIEHVVDDVTRLVVHCTSCGRLYVQRTFRGEDYDAFMPEREASVDGSGDARR